MKKAATVIFFVLLLCVIIIFGYRSCTSSSSSPPAQPPSVNRAPVVNAGPDKEVLEGETVVLEGSAFDPDGDFLTFNWNSGGATLSNANALQAVFQAPLIDSDTTYSCIFTAFDVKGASSSDTVSIRVKNELPDLSVSKKGRNLTRGSNWSDRVEAEPGDRLEFLIEVSAGNDEVNGITLRDEIPSQVTSCQNRRIDDGFVCNSCTCQELRQGISLGWLDPRETRRVIYEAKFCGQSGQYTCGTVTLTNRVWVSADGLGERSDTVEIIIYNECYADGVCTYFPSSCCYWPPCPEPCPEPCPDVDPPPPPPPVTPQPPDICPPGEPGPEPP